MYKICSACKESKLLSDFSKSKSTKDNHHNQCKSCVKQYRVANKSLILSQKAKYRASNGAQIIEYRAVNKARITMYNAEYRITNKDKIIEYRAANKDRYNARDAKRRAAKLKALPKWLTAEQLEQIKELYTCAQMFKLYTGEEYHVDHIVPLQGENVCGLHVPWNLRVIPAKENLSKSNKLQENT